MSAKGRGVVERAWYPTPAWPVHRLLEALPDLARLTDWIEPMAGEGAIIRAVEEFYGASKTMPFRSWTAVELLSQFASVLRKQLPRDRVHIDDAFEFLGEAYDDRDQRWDVSITNPRFSLAVTLVEASLLSADHVIVLQRLNWLENAGRREFFMRRRPDVYVLPDRPSFQLNKQGKLGTDATAYAWFHFTAAGVKGCRTSQKYTILNVTSKDVLRDARDEQREALATWGTETAAK